VDGVQHGFLPGEGGVGGCLGVPVGAVLFGEGGGVVVVVVVIMAMVMILAKVVLMVILVRHLESGDLIESAQRVRNNQEEDGKEEE
jgi:hypothetical protein